MTGAQSIIIGLATIVSAGFLGFPPVRFSGAADTGQQVEVTRRRPFGDITPDNKRIVLEARERPTPKSRFMVPERSHVNWTGFLLPIAIIVAGGGVGVTLAGRVPDDEVYRID
jgi:hypothetical protein